MNQPDDEWERDPRHLEAIARREARRLIRLFAREEDGD